MKLYNELPLFAVRDSADRVVGEKGTYEELIACSHEIAGSTAQLVAASKVQTQVKTLLFSHWKLQQYTVYFHTYTVPRSGWQNTLSVVFIGTFSSLQSSLNEKYFSNKAKCLEADL